MSRVPCKDRNYIVVDAEESGIQRTPLETDGFKLRQKVDVIGTKDVKLKTQTEPISPPSKVSGEMPFSDEDEDGPNSFTYYTVPAVIHEVAESKTEPFGIEHVMPELKRMAVKGELSDREKRVFRYFRRRMIMDLMQFMMNHLLAVEPDDPIEFLRGLLDQCLLFRSGHLKDPPLLYGPEHLEALFRAFDPLETNYISVQQYHTAMRTMMLRNYNRHPEKHENNDVAKRVFISNAKMALMENLLDLILLTPSVIEKPPNVIAMDTTPTEKEQKLTLKRDIRSYMKGLMRGKMAAEDAEESPDEVVELEDIKKPPPTVSSNQKLEKFGDYARPIAHLQEAFKPSPELHF